MTTKKAASSSMLSASFAALICAASVTVLAQPAAAQTVAIDADDIGGVVTGPAGPEAGVWVIAETRDLPTKYVKIVVTDAQGRYVLPDMPRANYDIWVRGYGLVDSPKVQGGPGKALNLTAVKAPNRKAAAEYYPAIYWYSMLKIPEASLFPGTGPQGNDMPVQMRDQGLWLRYTKTDGCIHCHQIGDLSTRTFPVNLGTFASSMERWERRIQSGPAGRNMVDEVGKFGTPTRVLGMYADWTDRIAAGELPKTDPERPSGRERNVVVTQWDWNTPKGYLHDSVATDKRNPTINGNGLIYGAPEASSDMVPWLDPIDHKAGFIQSVFRDANTPTTKDAPIYAPSPYWGDEAYWDSHTNIHNPMFDEKGRLWLTARIRAANTQPAYCKEGSDHPSAKLYPKNTSNRQVEVYDPKTQKFEMIDLCFNTHHLQFDKDNVLWFSAGGNYDVIGWLDVKKWEETKDEKASQGWAPFILDTNGNGKLDTGWTEPNQPTDPTKDKRIIAGLYGVGPAPDGSVWGSVTGFPGGAVRFDPKTQLSEFFEIPYKNAKAPVNGFSPRGSDMASDGTIWMVLSSGHLASFDRRLCTGQLNGPRAADMQNVCPEGWRLYQMPGPEFDMPAGTIGASAEAPYYVWVDQHNAFGLGNDVPISTASQSDGLVALLNGEWIQLHVPYPMSFYPKNLDGRIDDINAGWKGRAVWTLYSGRAQTHIEGGKGNVSKVVKVQMRQSPLDK